MVIEAFGTFKRSEKGNSAMVFVPADLVADSSFPLDSSGVNSRVRIRIDGNRLLISVESPVKLVVYEPKKLRADQGFQNLTQLYEFLRPQFTNKMWRSFLPHMFLSLAKDGHFAGATMHAHLEASNSLNHYFKALQAAEETDFTRPAGLGGYEVVKEFSALGRFVTRFDELIG